MCVPYCSRSWLRIWNELCVQPQIVMSPSKKIYTKKNNKKMGVRKHVRMKTYAHEDMCVWKHGIMKARVYENTCVRRHVRMKVWVGESMGVWKHVCTKALAYESTCARKHVRMKAWVYESTYVRKHVRMKAWVYVSNYLIVSELPQAFCSSFFTRCQLLHLQSFCLGY